MSSGQNILNRVQENDPTLQFFFFYKSHIFKFVVTTATVKVKSFYLLNTPTCPEIYVLWYLEPECFKSSLHPTHTKDAGTDRDLENLETNSIKLAVCALLLDQMSFSEP